MPETTHLPRMAVKFEKRTPLNAVIVKKYGLDDVGILDFPTARTCFGEDAMNKALSEIRMQ